MVKVFCINGGSCFALTGGQARPEGPKPKAQRVDSRGEVPGEGAASPLSTSEGVWGGL